MNDNTTSAADKKASDKSKPAPIADAPVAELPMNHPDAPHVTIHLQKGEGDDEKDAQFVSINGNDFMVPRNVDVSVPVPVYEVLANAERVQLSEDGSESFKHNRFSMQVRHQIPGMGRGA